MIPERPVHGPRNTIVMAALTLAGFGLFAASLPSADSDHAAEVLRLLAGFQMTVFIWLVTCAGGAILAVLVVVAELRGHPLPRILARTYITFFRGTPLIAQLYMLYYGAGEVSRLLDSLHLWWMLKSPLSCVIIVFILNTSAYQAYVVAGAIRSLPKEQADAARSLGLSAGPTMFKVLLPQAMLIALRPLTNEATKMIKASAIASVVTVLDLMGNARMLFVETFDFSYLIIAACIYLMLIGTVRLAFQALDNHLLRHLALEPRRSGVAAGA